MFFGGEPLIKFNLIKFAILTLLKIDKKNSIKYNFLLFTNGVLLNNIDLNFIKKFKIELMISIDGDKKIHNKNRSKKGINSYNSIIKAMPKIKSLNIRPTAFLTLAPSAVKNLYHSFIHLKKLGFNAVEICPVFYSADIKFQPWDNNLLRILNKQIDKIIKNYFLKTKNKVNSFGLFKLYEKYIRTGLNYAELGQRELVIDVDGDVFIGDECLGFDKKDEIFKKISIGNILQINSLEYLFKKYIENKKNFRRQILKNSITASYFNSSVIKAIQMIYKVMARYKLLLDKINEYQSN